MVNFQNCDVGNGQPLDFDVRFVKSDKAKLAYFMPPPQITLDSSNPFVIGRDTIATYSRSGVTFDNTTVSSVWDFKNAKSVTGAITVENNKFYEYDITTKSGENYKVMLNVDGSGDIKVEFFEMQVGGGGAAAGGPGGRGGGMAALLFGGDTLCVDGPTAFPSSDKRGCPSGEIVGVNSDGKITLT